MVSESRGYPVWLNPREKEILKKASKISALSLSSFLREGAFEKARKIPEIDLLWKKAFLGDLSQEDISNFELNKRGSKDGTG